MIEVWKKINSKKVNPNWIINSCYEVSTFGRIRNKDTGKILKSNKKISLLARSTVEKYWARATFVVDNIVKATFCDEVTYCKHVK